ncbi:MAG: exodeoxyribonuclease VII small subunit [Deltaproteobacteria bacterium]|jgi:exodeoxyribonuclease VII small subunit|nr:exodeoxyribonuclease VII small subunit [Deltaproteobacteria bacterium]
MTEKRDINKMSYEERMDELNEILTLLDDSETPIDRLAADTKRGVALINSLKADLKAVEIEVKNAFADLDTPDKVSEGDEGN